MDLKSEGKQTQEKQEVKSTHRAKGAIIIIRLGTAIDAPVMSRGTVINLHCDA